MDPLMRYNNRDIVVISLCQAIISCNLAWISISTVNNFDHQARQREEDMANEANGHLACSIPIPDVRCQFHPLPYPFTRPLGLVPNGPWLHRVRASNQSEWGRGNLANVDDTYGISTTITATTTAEQQLRKEERAQKSFEFLFVRFTSFRIPCQKVKPIQRF